jgi:stage V sporulation protein AE
MQFQLKCKKGVNWMIKILWAFLVGGGICVIGQLLMDIARLTPAHTMCVPICSFGNSLVKGAVIEAEKFGIIGVITGIFEITSAGISSAVIFGFLASLIFRPKG